MRKLATAAAVSLALASSGVFGLGLGDIEMRSALNQPMNAEIRLTSVKPGELNGMIVQLASEDAFVRAGIERSPALTDLTFAVDSSSGTPVIRISSNRPVVEPFLNFLLEVDWNQGRMVREYTVLLDPPVFMTPSETERNDTADSPATTLRGEEALVVPTPIVRESGSEAASEAASQAASQAASDAEGELVALDELSDAEILALGNPASDVSSDVSNTVANNQAEAVALTDLAAPNTQATAELQEQVVSTFDINDIEVSIEGGSEEVSDDIFVNQSGERITQSEAEEESTIVSLDEDSEQNNTTGSPSEVVVEQGDTLFEIAQANAVSGLSVQQMMLALLAANESSFINNNINLVRAGSILRIPDASEVSSLSQTEALVAIGEQTRLWQEYRDSLRATQGVQLADVEPAAEDSASSSADAGSENLTTELAEPTEATESAEELQTAASDDSESLSAEALAILEDARQEVLEEAEAELKIVADSEASAATASATADETGDNSAVRLGEVNRQLQMTREELAAENLRSTDLGEQVAELDGTTANMDALVALRQNEIARLEAQLTSAREAETVAAQDALTASTDTAAQAVDNASDQATDVVEGALDQTAAAVVEGADAVSDEAGDAAQGLIESAGDAADNAAQTIAQAGDSVGNAVGEAGDTLENTAESVLDSGTNALTEAGQELEQVELLTAESENNGAEDTASEDTASEDIAAVVSESTDTVAAEAGTEQSWLQGFLADPKRMIIAGIGAFGLLGILATLLFRRKREKSEEGLLDTNNLDEFEADAPNSPDISNAQSAAFAGADTQASDGNSGTAAVAGMAAGAAAIGAAASTSRDDIQEDFTDDLQDDVQDDILADSTLAFGETETDTTALLDSNEQDDDLDDTISEADVYLSYGLHGQAEELLTNAIEREPNNEQYVSKLLEAYHAQGDAEKYHETAQQFQARFGGTSNPSWSKITSMGAELSPDSALYQATQTLADSESDLAALSPINESSVNESSFNSSIEDNSPAATFNDSMEASSFHQDDVDLLDQSLDPAFAFDESDLEATGDFSQIANELASENADGSLEFPGLETTGTAANETLEQSLSDSLDTEEPLSLDELSEMGDSVDDLTLDLDQLTGDLDLDSSELLNADLSDLDIPELTGENDLLNDSTGGDLGGPSDEMETMMDLAKAYIDMGDKDSASSALGEIVKSGNPEQVTEAETLLRKIS